MSIELPFGSITVGLERPVVALVTPVAVVVLWYLVQHHGRARTMVSRRAKLAFFLSRLIVVMLIVTAAAGPYTVTTRSAASDPQVVMLVDQSASMAVTENVSERLETAIEKEGVSVVQSTIASRNASRIGEALLANVRPNASLLVVSDGQVTGGVSLAAATEVARQENATINRVALETTATEQYVTVRGPSKTSVNVTARFVVRVAGTEPLPTRTPLTVSIDGKPVYQGTVNDSGIITVRHNFSAVGSHRVTARLDTDDTYTNNDVYRKSVRVVEQPNVLYVGHRGYPLATYLADLYDVTHADHVPSNLTQYHLVVLQNEPARTLGNLSALQRFVIRGNGLVVVGGDQAYGRGNYQQSQLSTMLPVRSNETGNARSRIVLAVDVSGSAEKGMQIQKALALDVLSQLDNRHAVGVVAFSNEPYKIAEISPLSSGRTELRRRIKRLTAGGGTSIGAGLTGSGQLLGEGGTVILISDGQNGGDGHVPAARALRQQGTKIITVGVGSVNAQTLQQIATIGDGTFLLADETNRLRILFGGDRGYHGDGLTIVDDEHFITAGTTLTTSLSKPNRVAVKPGATYLVSTSRGSPAVAAWRFGLGRVVSVTAYSRAGGLDGLLSAPNSLLVTKAVNWGVGDPERKRVGIRRLSDTQVGNATRLVYVGSAPPKTPAHSFQRVDDRRYVTSVVPHSPGYHAVLGREYAANYRPEYAGFGQSAALDRAVDTTGGRAFDPDAPAVIADEVKRQVTRVREIRREWAWPLLLVALLVYLTEVVTRRLCRRHGHPFHHTQ